MILIYLWLSVFIIGSVIQTITYYYMRRSVTNSDEPPFFSLISHNWNYIKTLKLFHKKIRTDKEIESIRRDKRTVIFHYIGVLMSTGSIILLILEIRKMI